MSEYHPTYQPPDRSNTASPFSLAQSGPGPSFKTNVNRNKTKRWVNAKKYSYDGDDWGSSEDEDEEESPPPVPLLKNPVPHDKGAPSPATTVDKTEPEKPLPFVRPADIYKRMVDERERQREQQSTQSPVTSVTSNTAVVGATGGSQHAHPHPEVPEAAQPQTHEQHPISTSDASPVPHVTDSGKTITADQSTEQTETTLHHNPSLGFRSAVHQAFDSPDTPDTLNRTNSDSTISPIIRSGTAPYALDHRLDMHNTPTIEEEPTEKRHSVAVDFKPGYRRSMSPPNPENSPAQKPTVSANLHRVKSDFALVADPTPVAEKPDLISSAGNIHSPEVQDAPPSASSDTTTRLQDTKSPETAPDPMAPSPTVPPKDETLPEGQVGPTVDTRAGVPTVNIDQGSPGSEYTNSVNDRLREEIMRSLTPNGSLGEEQRVGLVDGQELPVATQATQVHEDRPQLKKKFSWEQESENEDEGPNSAPSQPIPSPKDHEPAPDTGDAAPLTVLAPEAISTDSQASETKGSEITHGAKTDDPTLEMQTTNIDSPELPPPEASVPLTATKDARNSLEAKTATPGESRPTTAEMRFMGFREIVAIKDQQQKMEAYRTTRDKFAEMDTGLEAWIQHMAESPDHGEVVSLNGRVPAGTDLTKLPPRSKFPKLSSIGSISLPSHRDTSSPSSHIRHGSVNIGSLIHGQNKGKDLLHSAGVLGGKAGGAAKGLFAKGRSKFRQTSTSDKVRTHSRSSSIAEPSALSADEHVHPVSRPIDRVRLRSPVRQRPLSLDPELLSLLTTEAQAKPGSMEKDESSLRIVVDVDRPPIFSPGEVRNGGEMTKDSDLPLEGDILDCKTHTVTPSQQQPIPADLQTTQFMLEQNATVPAAEQSMVEEKNLQEITPTTPKAQLTLAAASNAGGRPVEPSSQETTPTTSTQQGTLPVTTAVGLGKKPAQLVVPSRTHSDSSMSPVSKLSVEIEQKDRALAVGPDGYFVSRAESVSTTGLSRNPTRAEPRLSLASVPSPISQVAPVTDTPAPPGPHHRQKQKGKSPEVTSRRFSFEDNDKEKTGRSVADSTVGETNIPIGGAPGSTVQKDREERRGPQAMSSFEKLCEFGDFSPGSIRLPSSQRPQLSLATLADRRQKPLPQPPQILGGTQYKSLLADAVTSKAALVDASSRIPTSQSRVASAPLNSPVSSLASPATDVPTGARAATVTAATRHTVEPDDLTALPRPPTAGSTAIQKKQKPAQSSQHAAHTTQPPQPVPMQSGSAFANLVSKIQRGHQSNAPSFSGMKNIGHRFQAFRADIQKPQKADAERPKSCDAGNSGGSLPQNGTGENLSPLEPPPPRPRAGRSGSFSMLDAKKTVVQKFLKRSNQPAEQAQPDQNGTKKATRRFNNFLGKPNEQPAGAPGAIPPGQIPPAQQPPARNNYSRQRHELLNQLQHLRQASREEPRQHPEALRTGRPRYYKGQQQSTAHSSRRSPSPSLGSSTTPSSPVRSSNTYSPFPPPQPPRGRHSFLHQRTHTADLHLRSRSPLSRPPASADEQAPTQNTSDPASNLGTFYSASPKVARVGDQEKPWNLTLPKGEETETEAPGETPSTASPIVPARFALPESGAVSPVNPAAAHMPAPALPRFPPTSNPSPSCTSPSCGTSRSAPRTGTSTPAPPQNTEPQAMAPDTPNVVAAADQLRQNARHIVMEPVELPVPGDDSSEEIVMSSTAYPGQEWRPSCVESWD